MKEEIVVVILLCLPTLAHAQSTEVTLGWDANTETDLAGYRLYSSAVSGTYSGTPIATIQAGTEEHTVTLEPGGDVYFVATAFDTSGNESGYSNEVQLDRTDPGSPTSLRIKITVEVEVP
jgi:hypothetical protein